MCGDRGGRWSGRRGRETEGKIKIKKMGSIRRFSHMIISWHLFPSVESRCRKAKRYVLNGSILEASEWETSRGLLSL